MRRGGEAHPPSLRAARPQPRRGTAINIAAAYAEPAPRSTGAGKTARSMTIDNVARRPPRGRPSPRDASIASPPTLSNWEGCHRSCPDEAAESPPVQGDRHQRHTRRWRKCHGLGARSAIGLIGGTRVSSEGAGSPLPDISSPARLGRFRRWGAFRTRRGALPGADVRRASNRRARSPGGPQPVATTELSERHGYAGVGPVRACRAATLLLS